jgi:superfamily II DNA/RNA helicase
MLQTPGRLADHVKTLTEVQNRMKNVKFFVLDEADRLLDGGFARELNTVIGALPDRRTHPRYNNPYERTWDDDN